MELTTIETVRFAAILRYLRVAAVAMLATGSILAGHAYLGLGELLSGWMASAQPAFMTLGTSGVMANGGFGAGVKILIGRLARAVFY